MAHSISPSTTPSAAYVLRVGVATLWVGLVGLLALTLATAWLSPERTWLIPAGLAGLIATWTLLRDPVIGTYAAVGLAITALNKETGLQPNQVAYGLFVYAFLGIWYIRRILQRESFINTGLDRAVALLLFIGMPLAILLGLLFGASLSSVRGEAISFSMLGFYFPVKEVCRKTRRGPEILAGLVIFIGVFVAIRNLVGFRETIISATQAWQIADARAGGGGVLNEIQLLFGTITSLVLLLHIRSWKLRGLLIFALVLCLAGLVMTRSRGYYVDLALGVMILLVVLQGHQRWRLTFWIVGGGTALVIMMMAFLGPIADLILDGTLMRLVSLGSATSADISLINRFHEAGAVIDKAWKSPILGWGLGAQFTYFDLIYRKTFTTEFIHNGYVAIWFKLGLWGLILVLGSWAASALQGLRAYRAVHVPMVHRAIVLSAAVGLVSLIPSTGTSSPFFTRELLQAMAIQMAIAAGIYQRYMLISRPVDLKKSILSGE